jgi:hypothetical protein
MQDLTTNAEAAEIAKNSWLCAFSALCVVRRDDLSELFDR